MVIYVETELLTPEFAAEVLVKIDELMEQGGVPFYAISLTLETPKHEYYSIENFRRADIRGDGLVERINENRQKTQDYYDKIDKENS